MSTYMSDAVNVALPSEGDSFSLATSTTSFNHNIPSNFRGRWVTVTAIDQPLAIQVGDDNVDVEYATDNAVSGDDITFTDVVGRIIPANSSIDFRFPDAEASYVNSAGAVAKITKFAVEAAGAGRINMSVSHRRN